MNSERQRHGLVGIIGHDLLSNARVPLLLFLAIAVCGTAVVTITHHTRLLTAERERLVLERDALDIEWRHLILEEHVLGDHHRVERIATERLKMHYVDPSKEMVFFKQ